MIIAVNFPISTIGRKKPENIGASTGFEPVTSATPGTRTGGEGRGIQKVAGGWVIGLECHS